MSRFLAVCLALAFAFGATGAAAGGPGEWPQPDARDRALLASIVHGMRTNLRTVRLTQLSSDWRNGRPKQTLELLTTTSVSREAHARSIRAAWDTLLIAHAYNERCVRGADHCLGAYMGPGGGSGAGRSGARRPFSSAHVLARAIRREFAAVGLRVSIAFEHPNALAPIITVHSSHPRPAYKAERKAEIALLPALRHAEGVFVQMFDSHGRLFYVTSGSGSTGEGWCAPQLQCPVP